MVRYGDKIAMVICMIVIQFKCNYYDKPMVKKIIISVRLMILIINIITVDTVDQMGYNDNIDNDSVTTMMIT